MVAPVQHIRRLADPDFRMTEVARGRTGQGVIFTGDLFREKADVAVVRTEDQPFFLHRDKIFGHRQRGRDPQRRHRRVVDVRDIIDAGDPRIFAAKLFILRIGDNKRLAVNPEVHPIATARQTQMRHGGQPHPRRIAFQHDHPRIAEIIAFIATIETCGGLYPARIGFFQQRYDTLLRVGIDHAFRHPQQQNDLSVTLRYASIENTIDLPAGQ